VQRGRRTSGGQGSRRQHTEVFASTLIITTCCKGRVALYFILISPCFLKLLSQPRAFAPKDLFNAVCTISCICVIRVVVITITPPSFVSVICNADSGETLLGPASIICSACNACCHCRICSTSDRPKSIQLMRCAVTAPSDHAANFFIFCGCFAVSA